MDEELHAGITDVWHALLDLNKTLERVAVALEENNARIEGNEGRAERLAEYQARRKAI